MQLLCASDNCCSSGIRTEAPFLLGEDERSVPNTVHITSKHNEQVQLINFTPLMNRLTQRFFLISVLILLEHSRKEAKYPATIIYERAPALRII